MMGTDRKGNMSMMAGKKEEARARTKNAYMLVYERVAYFHMPTVRQMAEELRTMQDATKVRTGYENAKIDYNSLLMIKVTADVEKQIVEENARYKLTKAVLNVSYLRLMNYLILKSEPFVMRDYKAAKKLNLQRKLCFSDDLPLTPHESAMQRWKFFFTYTLTSLLRVTMKSAYPETLRQLRMAAQADVGLSLWLLDSFSQPQILNEFMVACPVAASRFVMASLLSAAFDTVFRHERQRVKMYSGNLKLVATKLLKKGELKSLEFTDDSPTVGTNEKDHSSAKRETYYLPPDKCGLPRTIVLVNNLLALLPRVLVASNGQSVMQYCFLLSGIARGRPEIIKYLLLSGLAGVLLETLLEAPGEHLAQMQKLRFIAVGQESSLGLQRNVPMDAARRKDMAPAAAARPKHFCFFVELLSMLIRSCKFKSDRASPQAISDEGVLPYTLPESELALAKILTADVGLQKLLVWGNNCVASRAIADMLAHLAFEDSDNSKRLIDWLMLRMGKACSRELQVCLSALDALVSLRDQFKEDRIILFVAYFVKICVSKDATESYLAFSYATDLFIKLALESETIHKKLQTEGEKFAFISAWLKRHSYPEPGEIYWEKTANRAVDVKTELPSEHRAACKLYSKQKLSLMEQLGMQGTAKKPAPDLRSLKFAPEEQYCMVGLDYSEPGIISKDFDIM